jgi:hypothetical protein
MLNKIFIIFPIYLLLIGCTNNNLIYYKWDYIKYECKNISNEEQEIIINVKYIIKNNTKGNIWLYDMQKGNDWQYVEYERKENIIEKRIFIYKPYEKSNNGWYGSGGYNPVYPDSFLIRPNKTIRGEMYISYAIENLSNAEDLIYRFNFIILEINIREHFNQLTISDMNEKYSTNYFVDIKIPRADVRLTDTRLDKMRQAQ